MTDLKSLKTRFPDAVTFKFGDNPDLSAALLSLVRDGTNTATCGALRDFQDSGEILPEVGRRDIALNWDDTPSVVIETLAVDLMAFKDVPESFALAEGENNSLAGWRRSHRAYFERNGGWSEDMMLVCERFRVVEVL